jgi:hypothetical protein
MSLIRLLAVVHVGRFVRAAALASLSFALLPSLASGQSNPRPEDTLGTLGAAVPMPARWTPPTGPAPRLPNGKPDFSGVWDHPYVPDMSASRNPKIQTGAGPLPYTDAGLANIKSYDPEKNGDYTGMCMPFGLMRSMNAPYPMQIMQNEKYVAFLFEQNTWFHVVPFRDRHSDDPNPTWFGESIAKWDGDTLVIDTIGFNGYTRLDTRGNPHSKQLHLVQRFRHTDAGHLQYTVTVDDPVYYSKPWTNERVFTLTDGDLLEYSCEENNRSLWEGRIKLWVPPDSEPLRNPTLGQKP